MRVVARSFAVVLLAIVGAVLLALTSTMSAVLTLAATQIWAMGGTGHPLSTPPDSYTFVQQYLGQAQNQYVTPSTGATGTGVAIITPEQFRFDTGLTDLTYDQSVAEGQQNLNSCLTGGACNYNPGPAGSLFGVPAAAGNNIVVFGYSQSATIASLEKASLIQNYPNGLGNGTNVSFVLIGNPNRPNGGFLARGPQGFTIPIVGATFSGPTPTGTAGDAYPTVDIAQQYDGFADGPENPVNLLADANAVAGVYYVHGSYGNVSLTGPNTIDQGTYGDTQYYMIGTYPLPLLMPLESVPVIGFPLADTLDPPLRVLVESAYDRTISPGVPTSWNPLYFPNPITTGVDFLEAIPVGLDNGVSDFTGGGINNINGGIRPFGTIRPGAYGVGSPITTPVPQPTPVSTTSTISTLFSSSTGLLAFLDPTTLLSDLTTFSQLTSILNGGLPADISSLVDPLSGLTSLGSVLGQTGLGSNIVPAVESSPSDTSGSAPTTTPTRFVADQTVQTPQGTDSNQQRAPKLGAKPDLAQGSSPLNDTNSGPKLNVSRPSLWVTPGSQLRTSSTTGPQSTVSSNPIGSAISGVTNSIKSALGALSKGTK